MVRWRKKESTRCCVVLTTLLVQMTCFHLIEHPLKYVFVCKAWLPSHLTFLVPATPGTTTRTGNLNRYTTPGVSINQLNLISINQSIQLYIKHSNFPSINQSNFPSIKHSIPTIHQSNFPSINQAIQLSNNQAIQLYINQSIKLSIN